ncbi:MAG: hypothetical protein HXX08_05610 [Chloroflexi bacterium]|uniref:Sacsin/Nov domain-containing protein n=1 Tax=Candidatus Chlorohelix allophototropha TaxID=3003348 RepID=A0A8T7M0B2_9CHLR|nr:hypothetical protein [Chloroflexota bacterium]WJW67212.1 hypothetical protein OZ401_000470 [Chloroflexota bacterium L227-S17]
MTTDKTPQGSELISYLQKRFTGMWQRLASDADPTEREFFLEEYLRDLEERAYLETTIANQYRNRYLAELVQNAVDAMHRHVENNPVQSTDVEEMSMPIYRCHIQLTRAALYVANDGQPFQAEDVRSITAMGKSSKSGGRYIGYKGLGFRSVLEITAEPQIFSGDYHFRFSSADTLALLQKTNSPSEITDVPVLSVPFLCESDSLPADEHAIIADLKARGFVTVVRLPLKPGCYDEVKALCREFMQEQSLLFLPYITSLSLRLLQEPEITLSRTSEPWATLPGTEKLINLEYVTLLFQPDGAQTAWLIAKPLEPLPIAKDLLENLNDRTWLNVSSAGIALAFPVRALKSGGSYFKRRLEPLPFFTHFPTGEASGLGFAVHADFYLSASRKQIEDSLSYNRWLSGKIADFLCHSVLPELQERFPDEANLLDLLADVAYHNGAFGLAFRKILDDRLMATPFVPVGAGEYRRPREVVWTPQSGAGVLLFLKVFPHPPTGLHYPVLQLEEAYIAEEEGFEYRRVRRFLQEMGVRPVRPDELPELLPQAFKNLNDGIVTVSDICTCFALWLEQLAKGTFVPEERQRALLQAAKELPVLPVGNEWLVPNSEIIDCPASERGFEALKARRELFGALKVISEKAYSLENNEFEAQIRSWHRRLGVKSLDPEAQLYEEPYKY